MYTYARTGESVGLEPCLVFWRLLLGQDYEGAFRRSVSHPRRTELEALENSMMLESRHLCGLPKWNLVQHVVRACLSGEKISLSEYDRRVHA
jgi:hypothetical protein